MQKKVDQASIKIADREHNSIWIDVCCNLKESWYEVFLEVYWNGFVKWNIQPKKQRFIAIFWPIYGLKQLEVMTAFSAYYQLSTILLCMIIQCLGVSDGMLVSKRQLPSIFVDKHTQGCYIYCNWHWKATVCPGCVMLAVMYLLKVCCWQCLCVLFIILL